jgi:uncharacterized protein YbjQ (UPF0145 family)
MNCVSPRKRLDRHGIGRRTGRWLRAALLWFTVVSCATVPMDAKELPPILAQQQLVRPYEKIGVVDVSRERFYNIEELTQADYEWAYRALREEAQKLGADAVIKPEVKLQVNTYQFFPSSEISAVGIAIRYR